MLMEVAFMRSVRDVNTDTCLKNEKKLYQMMNVEKVVIMNYTTYGGVQNLKLMDRSGNEATRMCTMRRKVL